MQFISPQYSDPARESVVFEIAALQKPPLVGWKCGPSMQNPAIIKDDRIACGKRCRQGLCCFAKNHREGPIRAVKPQNVSIWYLQRSHGAIVVVDRVNNAAAALN